MNPGTLTSQALLNCLVREVSGPEQQAWESGGHLMIRLARSGRLLRAALRRPSAGISPRLTGDVQVRHGAGWRPLGWERLASLIADELALATGAENEEFPGQVRDSHAALTAILAARRPSRLPGDSHIRRYLASEQALITGHRFHPAPKARQSAPREWLRYAPEAGARFPLRFLGVRDDVLACEGDTAALGALGGPVPPPGYRLLPAHPWQLRLLGRRPWLARAIRDRLLLDLGPGRRDVVPTSSVRTVYDPAADVFCKFSLSVRITNCVRTSAWYELAGAVALSERLAPVLAEVAGRFPGTALLGEPGYRTAALADRKAYEGLAVIVRHGLRRHLAPGTTPLLAASLAEPRPPVPGEPPGLFGARDPDWLVAWWEAYLRVVALPVLYALSGHGVVLEPHLQNVLVGVGADGQPGQVIFRDLEGVKLVSPRRDDLLAGLAPGIARALAYDTERGWNRIAYCLFVNHLNEIAAAIADHCPGREERTEADLWDRARRLLASFAREHGSPPQLRAILAGVPLPAKANLRARWARAADRQAAYVPAPSPFGRPAQRIGVDGPA